MQGCGDGKRGGKGVVAENEEWERGDVACGRRAVQGHAGGESETECGGVWAECVAAGAEHGGGGGGICGAVEGGGAGVLGA